jgi:hypothetical protein
MAIIPSLGLVAAWNDTPFDTMPKDPHPVGTMLAMLCAAVK